MLGLVCVGNEKSDWFLFSCLTLCWSLLPILLFQLKVWNAPVVGDGRTCTSRQKITKIKKYIYTHQSNYVKNSTSIIKLWENVQNRTRKQRPLIIFIKSTQVFQILDKNSSSIQHKYKLNPSEAHPRERNSNPKLLYHPGVESRNLNPRTLLPSRCHTPEFLYHPGKILPIEPTSRDMTW